MKSIRKISVFILILFCFQAANAGWIKQNSNTFAWLYDVYFLNEKTGWIAGSNGTLLKTVDGGVTWEKQAGVTQDTIRQINFLGERTGWLLCERNIYTRGSNSISYILKTTDGGVNWEKMEFAENDDSQRLRIARIFFDKRGNIFAVGESGALYNLPSGEDKWKKLASPNKYLLLGGAFIDDWHGVIVGGGGGILFTDDGGLTWNPSNVFGNAKGKFNSVFFQNQKNGWAVGSEGKIFQTFSAGRTWREQSSGVASDLNDVFFLNSGEGWAIGDDGTLLQTTTAGNVWTPVDTKIKHRLEKIAFIGKKGFIVGFGGTILTTDEAANAAQKPVLKIGR